MGEQNGETCCLLNQAERLAQEACAVSESTGFVGPAKNGAQWVSPEKGFPLKPFGNKQTRKDKPSWRMSG